MSGLFVGRDEAGRDVELDPDRLRTHGVVVGMTGSGKTGLCVVLLEELVRAQVPILAIDPKGDLANLALLFPSLSAEAFAPWVEAGADAGEVAARWAKGLADWGIDGARLRALKDQLALSLLTPGSDAGTPVDVLGAFRRPPGILDDEDTLREVVAQTVSGLLGLVGRTSDPVRDPAHIVLSHVLEAAWRAGEDPDLEALIVRLVDPPFAKVGVFPVDTFFPPDDRLKLAMQLNGVVASPSFAAWTRGVSLDLDAWLGDAHGLPAAYGGRTPVHVVSLAHLADGPRQFFLSLLLSRLRAWSRKMPGTSGLRAVLFFDEVAGYLPPHPHQPPTKAPLLSMMKQARAVGLGVLLATQNPVDVDYKALSNAGWWFLGRLQTAQDRKRLLQGLDHPGLDDQVAGLGKRRFMLLDAKEPTPRAFATRWAMSYLRGPFTRAEITRAREELEIGGPLAAEAETAGAPASSASAGDDEALPSVPPPAPGDQWFLDPAVAFSARLGDVFAAHAGPARADGTQRFAPAVVAELALRFDEPRHGFVLDHREIRVWYPLGDALPEAPVAVPLEAGDWQSEPPARARFAPLPEWLDEASELTALRKRVLEDVYRSETRGMFVHADLKLYGKAGETREAFAARVGQAVDAAQAEAIAKLRERFAAKVDKVQDRIRKKEATLVEKEGVASARRTEELVNAGETLLSFFFGRRRSVSTAVRKRRQTTEARQRVDRLEQELEDLAEDVAALEEELEAAVAKVEEDHAPLREAFEERPVGLDRNDLQVLRFGLLWVPASRRVGA